MVPGCPAQTALAVGGLDEGIAADSIRRGGRRCVATLSIMVSRVALRYHIGGATMGTYVTELYNSDGEQYVKIDGYESICFLITTAILSRRYSSRPRRTTCPFPMTAARLGRVSVMRTISTAASPEDGSSISIFPGALEIRDGYVYTTAVYDIDHQKTSDPLVTHSVRVNLKTGAQEILD